MKKVLGAVAALSMCWTLSQAETLKNARVYNEIKHDVSLPLRDMAKTVSVQKGLPHEIENHLGKAVIKDFGKTDAASIDNLTLPAVGTTDLLNFDGQAADGVAPPDTNGAVGATQYVQWVNLEYNVYDKTTGTLILGPVQGNAFWSGFGGTCQSSNAGDPIILYDKVAQRWFAAQNVFSSPYQICIAVSTSSDATGSYNRYQFAVTPSNAFPDYPKWGVWPDAYYLSFNVFTNGVTQNGIQACAADRNAMLAGGAATIQCFNTSNSYFSLMPSDQDGLTLPPTGSPNYYVSLGGDTTHLNLWQFHVDFVVPTNSTFTGPTAVRVPVYTLICQTTRSCIPQPTGGEKLDQLGGRVQYRFAYRNFGTYESLLISDTVKPGGTSTAISAVRWTEIRNPLVKPIAYQAGTIQDASTSYWMSGIAQDKFGDMALGFSASSTTVNPSVYYTGRTPSMPKGKMGAPTLVIAGTGVQKSTSDRWGDYSAMQVDPTDDCTFWYTQEYIKTTGSFKWSTRVNSFKFPGCK